MPIACVTISNMQILMSPPKDFSFYETLHSHGWRHLQPFIPDDEKNCLTRIERLSTGNVMKMEITEEDGRLSVQTEDQADAPEVEAITRRMFQLDHSIATFHAYCERDPHLAHIPRLKQGRLLCSPTVFEDCLKVILTTNTTWSQTTAMTERIINSFGSVLPSDTSLHAFPTPQQIAETPFDDFAAASRLGYRASAIHTLAIDVANGTLDLEDFRDPDIPTDILCKRILTLKGIGPYAAACLMLYLGRSGKVNVDSVARTLLAGELGHPVSDREVHDFFAKYGEWQGLVYNFYRWKHNEAA